MSHKIQDRFSQTLALLRSKNSRSLQEVADGTGISKTNVFDMEKGKSNNPTLTTLIKLADYFNEPVGVFFNESNDTLSKTEKIIMKKLVRLGSRDVQEIHDLIDSKLRQDSYFTQEVCEMLYNLAKMISVSTKESEGIKVSVTMKDFGLSNSSHSAFFSLILKYQLEILKLCNTSYVFGQVSKDSLSHLELSENEIMGLQCAFKIYQAFAEQIASTGLLNDFKKPSKISIEGLTLVYIEPINFDYVDLADGYYNEWVNTIPAVILNLISRKNSNFDISQCTYLYQV